MGTPKWKVYREGEYVAACKYAEDAAALIGVSTSGEVRYDHRHLVWTEGSERISAGDSYDEASDIMRARLKKLTGAARERSKARQEKAWAEIRRMSANPIERE